MISEEGLKGVQLIPGEVKESGRLNAASGFLNQVGGPLESDYPQMRGHVSDSRPGWNMRDESAVSRWLLARQLRSHTTWGSERRGGI